ncbi:MAG: hypothetical protein ABI306_07250 [Caulobacteraceae bacterium]
MSSALLSDFLMVDPRELGPRGSQARPQPATRREGSPAISGDEAYAAAFQAALADALEETLRQDPTFTGPSSEMSGVAETVGEYVSDLIAGRSVVLRLEADLADSPRAAVRTFLEKVLRVADTLETSRQEAAIAKLAEVILPDSLAGARGALAADNLELRDRFVARVACLNSAEVGQLAGHASRNPYATAARWKKAGDIISVHHRGGEYFPAFQFRDGRPNPTLKKVLAVLPHRQTAWQRALWFVSTNGWLGDRAPADVLDDPQAVVAAAMHEGGEVIG